MTPHILIFAAVCVVYVAAVAVIEWRKSPKA